MKTARWAKVLIITLLVAVSGLVTTGPADAAYLISYQSPEINITSTSGTDCHGSLTVDGESSLEQVWSCIRGPAGEIETYPAKVDQGRFNLSVPLRFGPGKYTIWAGKDSQSFDGTIRFEVQNSSTDTRYTDPSGYVDSQNPEVAALAKSIAKPEYSQMEKLTAIHDWVAGNIEYDVVAYQNGENKLTLASETIKNRKGMCRDYSFAVAALARASGLPTRIVYGEGVNPNGAAEKHAWNEVMIDGRWVSVDTTWDAGYVGPDGFVRSLSERYLDPDQELFNQTHRVTTLSLH
ncbi:MAG: transglutaminase domain-containing protein [Firmicutes bacterium]|nr:transglutaminase domain-containing protein [Bacillota bacterium]